jgi:hypothetical protein
VESQSDVRRIALALPETVEAGDGFHFSVRNRNKLKGFVWVWQERVVPKKPRVPNPAVLAVRVASLDAKDILLAMDAETFFTEPHYDASRRYWCAWPRSSPAGSSSSSKKRGAARRQRTW